MSRQTTTRAQVSGYRFGLARAEHALVRRDTRMLHDPMRAQLRALIAGAVVGLLILAGAGVYGVIRPQPTVGDAVIVADGSGGLFVVIDSVLHPVANLASARLIVGSPAAVKTVGKQAISSSPRGAALGIAGAPASLPGPARPGTSAWTV
ncbi:MAG: type VII secretion protein EccB, partial [Gordonia sp. (in: high G+C Gram-positive bacteria)]